MVYCTFSGDVQARALKRALEERGEWKVILAPLGGQDLLAAIEGTRAGDFAVFPEAPLLEGLRARRLVRGEPLRYDLRFYAVARQPFALSDLSLPGKRLGSFRTESLLSQDLSQALPEAIRSQIEANIRQRSDRPDELVRLLRLGALDAAFIWAAPPAAADLQVVPVGDGTACCPILIVPLACSRLTDAQTETVLDAWRDPAVARALQEPPASPKAGTP